MTAPLQLVQLVLCESPGLAGRFGRIVSGLAHVNQQISWFLVDLYALRLPDAVEADSRWLLDQLLDETNALGHRHPFVEEICGALVLAARTNRLEMTTRIFGFLKQHYASLPSEPLRSFHFESATQGSRDWRGQPFEIACEHGHLEMVRWYVDHQRNKCTTKAAKLAASGGHSEVLRFLCERELQERSRREQEAQEWRRVSPRSRLLSTQPGISRLVTCLECLVEAGVLGGHIELAKWVETFGERYHQEENGVESNEEDEDSDGDGLNAASRGRCSHPFTSVQAFHAAGSYLETIIAKGGLEACLWLKKRLPEFKFDGDEFFVAIQKKGSLDLVKWLYESTDVFGCDECRQHKVQNALLHATTNNRLDVIEFLYSKGHLPSPSEIPELFRSALSSGSLEIAEFWQQKHGKRFSCPRRVIIDAAIAQSVDCIRFCDPQFKVVFPQQVAEWCIEDNHTEMLQFLFAKDKGRVHVENASQLLEPAIVHGHLDTVKLVFEYVSRGETEGNVRTRSYAPLRVEELVDAIHAAADCGFLDVVHYILHNLGMEEEVDLYLEDVLLSAIGARNLEVVRLLHDVIQKKERITQLPLLISRAIMVGSSKIVRYLCESHPKECLKYRMMRLAASQGLLPIVKDFHMRGVAIPSEGVSVPNALHCAASRGHIEVVKYLDQNCKGELCTASCVDDAFRKGHLRVVKYLFTHCGELSGDLFLTSACRYGNLAFVQWLLKQHPEQTQALDLNEAFEVARRGEDDRLVALVSKVIAQQSPKFKRRRVMHGIGGEVGSCPISVGTPSCNTEDI